MKHLLTLLAVLALPACANLQPKTVTSSDRDVQSTLVFKASTDETGKAIKEVLSEKRWKLLYEGEQPPKNEYSYFSNRSPLSDESYDRIAWDKSLNSTMPPRKYLQAKTPTNAFSFGAELFITLFESPEKGTVVSITASTSQIIEKDKLDGYIDEFAAQLNKKTM